MFVADGYSAFFAYRLSGLVAKIALPGLVPDYLTSRCLKDFAIRVAESDELGRDYRYV